MCKEDIREGRRKTTGIVRKVIAAGATEVVLGRSRNRTHISFGNGVTAVSVRPIGVDAIGSDSFKLQTACPPLEFDIERHGGVVKEEWQAKNTDVADTTLLILETAWEDPDGKS